MFKYSNYIRTNFNSSLFLFLFKNQWIVVFTTTSVLYCCSQTKWGSIGIHIFKSMNLSQIEPPPIIINAIDALYLIRYNKANRLLIDTIDAEAEKMLESFGNNTQVFGVHIYRMMFAFEHRTLFSSR